MPPKKTSQSLFTQAEQLLLDSASRIFVGTQYKESHSVGNHDMFELNLSVEMIHCIHGAIAAVSLEYQASVNEKRLPNYTTITSDVIKQHVTRICQSYPDWPDKLKSMDLSAVVDVQLDTLKWWLPITSTGEDNNNLGCCRSNRSNKGRPPVTADDNVGGRAPSQNKKRSVDAITNSDNEAANDGDNDEDNEDEYEGKDDNENEEDKDNTTPLEYYSWFGTNKASHFCTVPSAQSRTFISVYHNGTHPSLQRHAPEKWASMVKLLRTSGGQYKEAPVLQASTSEVLPPPPPPAVVTPVVAPPCHGRPPKNVAGA
ncbi:hypothetical protein V8E53_000753 [Lactarius tabidus]